MLAAFFSERWDLVWQGTWLVPLLGIIFLPYTTVMYMLTVTPGVGILGWDWMWIALGVLLDVWKWAGIAQNRRQVPGYPQEIIKILLDRRPDPERSYLSARLPVQQVNCHGLMNAQDGVIEFDSTYRLTNEESKRCS